MPPRVLSIAGSDPSGGAGIQADIKSISAMGGYAMTAITALTVQNTQGVQSVHVPDAAFLGAQLDSLSEDIEIDAVKIGMLPTAEVIRVVGEWLGRVRPAVVVLDPVMVASSGDSLVEQDARLALLELLAHAHLVTPNLPELGVLVGEPEAQSWETALLQGKRLAARRGIQVLVKGGHLTGEECPDALVGPDGTITELEGKKILTDNTHGTGCSLSSALATVQVRSLDWALSLRQVKEWLTQALEHSDDLQVGKGRGPVNHFYSLWSTAAPLPGAFTRKLWDDCAPVRAAIFELPFITELVQGSLTEAHFAYYLAQDAQYLNAYSRVLARAGELAPTENEQRFWTEGAHNALEVELSLHRDWLSVHPLNPADAIRAEMGPVTKHYVDHLLAAAFAGSYGEVVAAVLPCYWLYADVARVLAPERPGIDGGHPYGRWLDSYADEAFANSARTAVEILDVAARRTNAVDRQRMASAFAYSAQCELDFFDAPRLHA